MSGQKNTRRLRHEHVTHHRIPQETPVRARTSHNSLTMWSYDIQSATPYGPWRPAKQPSDTNEQE